MRGKKLLKKAPEKTIVSNRKNRSQGRHNRTSRWNHSLLTQLPEVLWLD